MLSIRVNPQDQAEIRQAMKKLSSRLDDMQPILEQIGNVLVPSTKQRFLAGLDPSGRPWKIAAQAKRSGRKTLIKSGKLMRSIESDADASQLIVGSNVPYAPLIHRGGKTRSGKLTPRRILGISKSDRRAISEIMGKAIEGEWK